MFCTFWKYKEMRDMTETGWESLESRVGQSESIILQGQVHYYMYTQASIVGA